MKSRKKQKSAAPGSETGPSSALHVLRNCSVLPERQIDSAVEAADVNLSPLDPTGGAAKQLFMSSEETVFMQDTITR